jgi:nitrate/nitrite-specific signal transduction histidine kinase
MLNQVADNKQCDNGFQDGHRHAVQLAALLGSQPNSTGLRDAVRRLIAVSRACDGPEIEFCDDLADCELQPELQLAMSSIARELMLNAMCHSGSKKALVGIGQGDGYLFVQVQDWGVGFDPKSALPEGRGLKGIEDLVRWLGGTIEIDSQLGAGTCVIVEVPLSKETGTNHPMQEALSSVTSSSDRSLRRADTEAGACMPYTAGRTTSTCLSRPAIRVPRKFART